MDTGFSTDGFLIKRNFFSGPELERIEPALRRFHEMWLERNQEHYDAGIINSAYITHKDHLNAEDRMRLFGFISANKMVEIAQMLIPDGPAFINTQLFFDPKNPAQKNYWHRDIQYTDMTVEEQAQAIRESRALHFRVPLVDEHGIELIPGTHSRWDTKREYNTRMGAEGCTPSDALPGGTAIPLERGDLLVFSGNMIHRGLYGGDRFALDILFSDADPDLLRYVNPACLPMTSEMGALERPQVFMTTKQAVRA